MSLLWSSQFSVAACSAAVCDEAGGALAAVEAASPPHATTARPAPARSADRRAALRFLLEFTSVAFRAECRLGGGQVVAGDAVDLHAVGPGQQRGFLAGRQFGGHDRTLGGFEGLD